MKEVCSIWCIRSKCTIKPANADTLQRGYQKDGPTAGKRVDQLQPVRTAVQREQKS